MTFEEITVFVPCNVVFDEEMVFPASIFNNAVSVPFGFPSPDVTPNATLPKNVALAFEVKFAPLNKLNAPVCVKLADDERLEDITVFVPASNVLLVICVLPELITVLVAVSYTHLTLPTNREV